MNAMMKETSLMFYRTTPTLLVRQWRGRGWRQRVSFNGNTTLDTDTGLGVMLTRLSCHLAVNFAARPRDSALQNSKTIGDEKEKFIVV